MSGNIADLSGLVNLTRLSFNSDAFGSLSAVSSMSHLTNLDVSSSTGITGNISNLVNTTITNIYANNTSISGKLSDLGSVVHFNQLAGYGTWIVYDIDAFVANKVAAGVTSMQPSDNAMFINANTIQFGNDEYATSDVRSFITWNEANKIAVYNGSNHIADCSTVYARGATSSEIAAWEQAGKNVIIV